MYRISVTYTAKNKEDIRNFYDESCKAQVAEITRKEPGNISYEYYFSAERENELLLLEKWEDKDSQQAHINRPHLAKLSEAKEKYGIRTVIEEM